MVAADRPEVTYGLAFSNIYWIRVRSDNERNACHSINKRILGKVQYSLRC